MGHQVTFFAMPSDIDQIEAAVRRLEPAVILHSRSGVDSPRVVSTLNVREGGQPWLFYDLVRQGDLGGVVSRSVPTQGYWTVDVHKSPVVEVNTCLVGDGILRRGRLYYVDGFFDAAGAWIEKSEMFRRWAMAVFRVAKKTMKRHGSDYIGPEALMWIEAGNGRLVT